MKSDEQRDLERQSLTDTRWIYRGQIISLKLDTYQFPDKTKIAEVVDHPGAVVIVPIDEKQRVLLVQQWRRATGEIMLELPAGTLEKNESADFCAKRELREETGFATEKLTALGGFFSAPGFCNEYLHLFVAENLYLSPLDPDDDEQIDLFPTPLYQALQMIEENKIRDAKTIAGLFKYQFWKTKCVKS